MSDSDQHAIDEAAIAALVLLYARTQEELRRVIIALAAAGFTRAAVEHARAEIQRQLADTGQQAGQWVDQNVPETYNRALQAAGAVLLADELVRLHGAVIQTTKEELAARLSDALTSMGRSANYLISRSLSQALRAEIAGTTDLTKMRQAVLKALEDDGIYGLIDKAGRRWDAEVYADNVARTYLMQAHNGAVMNAVTGQGDDLVTVSAHGAKDACGPWEGRTLSITGNTPGYPTVGEATGSGLFHNNCKHTLMPAD